MADPTFVTERPPNAINLNISDVIEMINDDYGGGGCGGGLLYGGEAGDGGGGHNSAPSEAEYSMSTATTTVDPMLQVKQKAYVRIIEQPQSKALRFRYICEGRSAGSIPGLRSTAENKTYPAIEVVGYTGPAAVVVSCVTVDPPHRPHPHNLVGKDGCKKGICTMTINSESMQCVFNNLGIQCVKKRDVEDALKLREEIRVDPYKTGFAHRNQPQSIDLNALRLCFQVFVEGQVKGKMTVPLPPEVSQPIYDKKAACDLLICKLSDCTSSVAGGKEIILLCDKVTKEDIQVRFYEVTGGQISWEAMGDFQPSDVHKQVAIAFKTPRYKTLEVENPVKVYIQLQRPSDKTTSESRPFDFLPLDSGRPFLSFKRLKQSYGPFTRILGLDSSYLSLVNGTASACDDDEDLKRKLPSVNIANISMPGVGSSSGGGIINNNILDGTSAMPPRVKGALTTTTAASSEEVRQRMSAALKRRNQAVASPDSNSNSLLMPRGGGYSVKFSSICSPDVSSTCYSDAELLEDVLSEGSVNDLLSGVGGDGCTVYQDLETNTLNATMNAGLNTAITNTLNLLNSPGQLDSLLAGGITGSPQANNTGMSAALVGPDDTSKNAASDALYGDASYASCYSNLEFVMNRARNAQQQQQAMISGAGATRTTGDGLIRGALFPGVPTKTSPQELANQDSAGDAADDSAIYEVPSNRPVHLTKAALLQYRGFSVGQQANNNKNFTGAVTDMDMDQNSDDLLPKTVLDLFV